VITESIKEMMKMKLPLHRSNLGRLSALALVGLIVLTACGGGASRPPEITITAPEAGAALSVGQSVAIVGTATGDAISRVDVIIDGQTYATLNAPDKSKGVPSFPINVPWTPLSAGTHAIQMKAYGPPDDKLLTQSEPLVLNAQAASVPATPTAEAQATTAAVPTAAPAATTAAGNAQAVPTVAPPAGNNAQPAATTAPAAGNASNSAPSVTVTNDFVNVRTGPDTAYDRVGELQQNQTAPVKGKSADGKWWQISFPAGQGGVGWVISDYVQANAAANNVPVASAPPKPVVAQQPAQPVQPVQPAQPAGQPVLVPLVTIAPPQVQQPAVQPVAQGPLAGAGNVLRVEANPVAAGGTAFATWNIPSFREGCFDRGDGGGCKGPIAQSMRVDVPGVSGQRTIVLKWTDTNGGQQQDTLTLSSGAGVAPAPAAGGGGGGLVGGGGVLRVEGNPVPSGTTAYAFWNIPNFKEGCFDRGDGAGCKGPIAQAMRVDVPGVTGARTLTLRWTDTNGGQQQDSLSLNGGAVAVAPAPVNNPECNPNNPDWQAKAGNPGEWTFCKRKDPEYIGDSPGNVGNVDRNDKTYTMGWDVYGAKGVWLVFEPNGTRGPAGTTQLSIPSTGTGPVSFRPNQLENGCYKITLRIDTNAGNRADFGEKFLCVGVAGGGGGGGSQPNPQPQPNPPPQQPGGLIP
jgi:uncharacterized protein YraI